MAVVSLSVISWHLAGKFEFLIFAVWQSSDHMLIYLA